jgi:hypothetical protein
VANRLIEPLSEWALSDGSARTALPELPGIRVDQEHQRPALPHRTQDRSPPKKHPRVEGHILISVLAYHLLSWVRETL